MGMMERANKKETAIVLLSGGLDSGVCTAWANERYNLALLHLNYGQRTENKEYQSFSAIADHYHVKNRLVVDVSYLKQIGGSALTDYSIDVPNSDKASSIENISNSDKTSYTQTPAVTSDPQQTSTIPATYVPFRNTHLIAIAVSWAEVIKANKIVIGAVWEDSSGYPDCRPEYFKSYNELIKLGTKNEFPIEIITPIIHLSKKEIVQLGTSINAPLHHTWSCYSNNDKACGVCDSCLLRLKGFNEANMADPIQYVGK